MPQFLIDFGNWLYDILYSMAATKGIILENILFGIFDAFLQIGQLAISGLGLMLQPFGIQHLVNALPPDVRGMMVAIGLPEALGIVVSAIAVRLLLQLIPFTRLGS